MSIVTQQHRSDHCTVTKKDDDMTLTKIWTLSLKNKINKKVNSEQ